jgi:competence protein ComGF
MKSYYKSSLPAFTLLEIMIAMLITSLIISFSYSVYMKFAHILYQESEQEDLMLEMRLLEREIFRITQSCTTITREEDQLYFNFLNGYSCLEFSDTTMTILNNEAYHEKEYLTDESGVSTKAFPIEGWSAEYLNNRTQHIDRFQIRCRVRFETYTLTFNKIYPKQFLYSLNQP